jgi:hypothetical protein
MEIRLRHASFLMGLEISLPRPLAGNADDLALKKKKGK